VTERIAATNPERTFEILIVDDNPAEAELLRYAWNECKVVRAASSILHEPVDVIRFLRGANNYPGMTPDLIMLDYKMPVNGGVALVELKGDPDYLHIPVIVFSGSSNPRDFLEAYRRGANCCFQKPSDLEAHLDLVCEIAEHWLVKAKLPERER
jgi:CheY-like chemotaxis protein